MFNKIFTLFSLFSASTSAKLYSAPNVSALHDIFMHVQSNVSTLVLCNIEDVLIVPSDNVLGSAGLQASYRKKHFQRIKHEFQGHRVIANGSEYSKSEYLLSILFASAKVKLTSSYLPNFIKSLQRQSNTTVMGLSNHPIASYGVIHNEADLVLSHLRELGLSFDIAKSNLFKHNFYDYVSGIIFTGDKPKYDVIYSLLDALERNYDQVIMIDHSLESLQLTEGMLSDLPVKFTGVLFNKPSSEHKLDEEIADIQFQKLIDEGRWYSDQQVYQGLIAPSY